MCIHDIGITPDIVIERAKFSPEDEEYPLDDEDELTPRKKNGKKSQAAKKLFDEMALKDIKDPNEIEKRKKEDAIKMRMAKDNQVQSAISVIKGIRVYKKLQSDVVENGTTK